VLSQLYLLAWFCFVIGAILILYTLVESWRYTRYKLPKKSATSLRRGGPPHSSRTNFVILLPAFKEHEVIERTLQSFERLNYDRDRYRVLVVVDEKELSEKQQDREAVVHTACETLAGGDPEDRLDSRIHQARPRLNAKTRRLWRDYYLSRAEVLSLAVLSRLSAGADPMDLSVPVAYAILTRRRVVGEIARRPDFDEIFAKASVLAARARSTPSGLPAIAAQLYSEHQFFETTIDVVQRLKATEQLRDAPMSIDYTIVPSHFDGAYRNPRMLNEEVGSSKGRALNWGLQIVDLHFPATDVIGVFDSDARPHPDVLAYIDARASQERSPYVFYQGPIYLVRNYFDVGWICKQSSLQMTYWHRALYPMRIVKSRRSIIHLSGTNYFYTAQAIRRTDGYSPFHPTEDLGLAFDVYVARLEGRLPDLKILPHPYEEIEQTTESWQAWFKQQYRWASGCPYQIRALARNAGLSRTERWKLTFKLVLPLLLNIYVAVLGVMGLALTALVAVGAVPPSLPPVMEEAVFALMVAGFVAFMAAPAGIFVWSLRKGYISPRRRSDVPLNLFIILLTTIPYFILASIPVMYAWLRPVKGWGSKTPRTDERVHTPEQIYQRLYRSFAAPN